MAEQLDIDVLRTLKAIRDHGGVTKAADFLSLSQSAVSHKVRRLEHRIACQLLRRKPGYGLFTPEGSYLVKYADRILAIHDEALSGISRPLLNGRIRLGITEELVTTGLATALGRFSRLYPGVRVKTQVEQSLILEDQLEKSLLDMVVMQIFSHQVDQSDVILQYDQLVWVKSIDYDFPTDDQIPFIAFDQNCFYRQWAEEELANTGRTLDIVLECSSNEGVCNAVVSGLGVALIAKRHLRRGMALLDIVEPPDIAFVVRYNRQSSGDYLTALLNDISDSLAN